MDSIMKISRQPFYSIKKTLPVEKKVIERKNQLNQLSNDYQSFIKAPRAVFTQPSWVVELNQPLSSQGNGRVQILKTRLGEVQVFGSYVHQY